MYALDRDIKRPLPGIWNRIEPRPLKKDFSQVLRAEIYDPLWMLNRQWQFGEFRGEDTGSAVFARITLKHHKISRYKTVNGSVENYSEEIPLEVKAEQETVPFDLKLQMQFSLYFKKILQQHGLATLVWDDFVDSYKLNLPVFNNLEEQARYTTQSGSWLLWKASSQRGLLDGEALYHLFKVNAGNIYSLIVSATNLNSTQINDLNEAATKMVYWLEQTYPIATTAWQANRLEYQFSNAVPSETTTHDALEASEYYQGQLDWYAYTINDVNPDVDLVNATPRVNEDVNTYTENLTVLPTPVRFAGMPVPRWWEFEEGYVNLGDIAQDTVDIPKVLLAQFGLVFNNDWQLIPMKRPIGSLSGVEKIIVTDVFGQKTQISTANNVEDDWSLYALDHKSGTSPDGRLFIPPTLDKTLEGEALEVVRFVRDEMANQVWAVEAVIPSLAGEGMDGKQASEAVRQELARLLAAIQPPTGGHTAHYPLDGHAKDNRYALHGSAFSISPATDKWGQTDGAVHFAGSYNSYIELPASELLKPSPELTISIWVKPVYNQQDQYLLFTKNNQSTNFEAYALTINSGKFTAVKNAAGAPVTMVNSTINVQANIWYQLTMVIDANNLSLYVDGQLQNTVAAPHSFDYEMGKSIILGGTNEASLNLPFEGDMDELRFYNRALSNLEVQQLYNNAQAFLTPTPLNSHADFQAADFSYHYLINEVAEHWIPFVPVKMNPQDQELFLQRGKMLRQLPYLPEALQYIRPQGVLLNESTQNNRYFLLEEEVPRTGVTVTRSFQRARWLNGQVFTWIGRRKKTGSGEINSGLAFDTLKSID